MNIPFFKKAANREMIAGYMLIAPAVILFVVLGLASIIISVSLSFFHLLRGSLLQNAIFAGVENFKDFLFGGSPIISNMFWSAIKNNFIIAIALVMCVIPIGLITAFLLEKIKYAVKTFRTLLLVPMVASSVSVYYVWTGIYDPDGVLNQVLKALGLSKLVMQNGWLGEISTALPSLIAMLVWGAVPGTMILYLAGLQTIDSSLYDAADIDGAKTWQKLFHIVWPLLQPITVIVVIMNINSAFQIFEQVYIMTRGGPAGATQVVNMLVYNEAFLNTNGDIGRANAMGWTIFMATFILSMISMKSIKEKT